MFNLLPEHHKKAARMEYLLRMATVALYLCSAAVILGAVILIPAYVSTSLRIEEGERAKAALAAARSDAENPAAVIATIKRNVTILSALVQPVFVESIIERALTERPLGVTVAAVTFQNGINGEGTLSIKGTARTRSSLVAFVRALEGVPYFSKVELPISNLAKNENIPFTMSIPVARIAPAP
jgi:Tfp pilus assembly protein PilN